MNAQVLTNPPAGLSTGSRSVPALLASVAATVVAVSVVVAVDERTDVPPSVPVAPVETYDPMQAYVDALVERRRTYLASLSE